VLGVGGPASARLTCLATVGVASLSGLIASRLAYQFSSSVRTRLGQRTSSED
ncbi:chloride channel core, partial [filamentous cyanobacterium CCP2]